MQTAMPDQGYTPESESAPLPENEQRVQSLFPVLISLGVHAGYDSNAHTSSSGQGSWFTSQELTLSYDRLRGPNKIDLVASVQAVERFSANSDVNALLNLSATHEISPRLSLAGSIDNVYRAEPDFSSDVGPSQRMGNYFRSTDQISATYQWTDRVATVSSYSFRIIRYEDSAETFNDREEHTFGQEFRFELDSQTVLTGDYRFMLVNYDSFPRDSDTHFLLAGVDETFNPRLKAQLKGGASFRSFEQEGENTIDPTVEGSLDYDLARYSTLSWIVRYAPEEPEVQQALSRTTFRTGLQVHYGFTSKISSTLSFFYHHDDNQGGPATTPTAGSSFTTDGYDLLVSARYQLTRHIDMDASFQHTDVSSGGPVNSYSRNRYSVGMTFTF